MRIQTRQKAAQLRPDRSGRAGDEHRLARDLVARLLDLELSMGAAHEVVGRKLPEAGPAVAVHPVIGAGHDEKGKPRLQAGVEHLLVFGLGVAVEHESDAVRL